MEHTKLDNVKYTGSSVNYKLFVPMAHTKLDNVKYTRFFFHDKMHSFNKAPHKNINFQAHQGLKHNFPVKHSKLNKWLGMMD